MPIPIPAGLIASAVPILLQQTAIPVNVCRPDPVYPPKALGMQFAFDVNTVWNVNLQQGLPPMSQVSMMYMDATNCTNPVIVLFQDTGYEVQVQPGKCLLCPVFTTAGQLPNFFVVSNTAGSPSADLFNLILTNFFIPPFST